MRMARQSRPNAKGGRPRIIDEPCPAAPGQTYAEAILDLVRAGNPLDVAARASGISTRTLMYWRADGREGGDPRYVQFLHDCETAEAASIARLVLALREAVIGDPYEITRTVTKHVRDEHGRITPVVETTTTRGVRRYPRTAEWLLQRRAPEFFGASAAIASPPGPAEDVPAEVVEAASRQWQAYLQGVDDGAAERRVGQLESTDGPSV
jgi:hypothetical protein